MGLSFECLLWPQNGLDIKGFQVLIDVYRGNVTDIGNGIRILTKASSPPYQKEKLQMKDILSILLQDAMPSN